VVAKVPLWPGFLKNFVELCNIGGLGTRSRGRVPVLYEQIHRYLTQLTTIGGRKGLKVVKS